MRISDWSSDVCSSDLPGCLHPLVFVDRGDADRVSGLARELRRVVAHGAPITFAERMDGVDLVDVVAEQVEKIVSRKSAKRSEGRNEGKGGVSTCRDRWWRLH